MMEIISGLFNLNVLIFVVAVFAIAIMVFVMAVYGGVGTMVKAEVYKDVLIKHNQEKLASSFLSNDKDLFKKRAIEETFKEYNITDVNNVDDETMENIKKRINQRVSLMIEDKYMNIIATTTAFVLVIGVVILIIYNNGGF